MFIILLFLLVTPIHLLAGELRIKSDPEKATVFIRETASDKRIKLGETPLKMDLEEIFENYTKDRTFVIEVEKYGHKDYNLMASMYGRSSINLNVKMEVSQSIELTKNFDALANKMFEAQRLLRDKRYKDAIELLVETTKKHGDLSVVFELLASAYYLDKQFEKALSTYRKAFSLNADNSDAYSMKLYLEKALGVRSVK
jgi:tetratricopeptide (TPR) repeat protein